MYTLTLWSAIARWLVRNGHATSCVQGLGVMGSSVGWASDSLGPSEGAGALSQKS